MAVNIKRTGRTGYPAYKPSGVEWIGDVPEHWEVWRFSHLFRCGMGETILKERLLTTGLLPVFSATESDTIFGYVNQANVVLQPGDIIIPARGNSIGHAKEVRRKCTTTQTTIFARSTTGQVNSRFVYYYLISHRHVLFFFDRTAIPQITVDYVSRNPQLVPPIDEQRAIAAFLDRETGRIDAIIGKVRTSIDKLREYRTALISAAVTGKIDVRGEVM